jgi:hypothetical protein
VLAPGSSFDFGPVLVAANAEQVLTASRTIATARAFTYPGSTAVFESLARRAYVADYDVEVAQKAKVADPVIDTVPSGRRLRVRVDPTAAGDLMVAVSGQETSLDGPVRRMVLHFETDADLELPVAFWAATTASARVPNGGALLIGNDFVPNALWMIRVRAAPEPPAAEAAPVRFVPAGGTTQAPLRSPVPSFLAPSPSGAESRGTGFGSGCPSGPMSSDPDESEHREDRRLHPDRLVDLLTRLGPAPRADQRPALAAVAAPLVALAGDAAFQAKGRDLVARTTDETLRTFALELRAGEVPAEGWRPPAPEAAELLAFLLPIRAANAAIAGDRVLLLAGRVHAYLKDYDVEIAEGASIGDPLVASYFTGLSFAWKAVPAGKGQCLLQGHLERHEQAGAPESQPSASREIPAVELPRVASAVADISATLPLGAWTILHVAPLEGTGMQVVTMIRIRES